MAGKGEREKEGGEWGEGGWLGSLWQRGKRGGGGLLMAV